MIDSLTIDPPLDQWKRLAASQPDVPLFGLPLSQWRRRVRQELGLPVDKPVIATGHQTLLWHPGILAKYLAVDAATCGESLGAANLIVDQHADGFDSFEAPVRRSDGSLAVQQLRLTTARPAVPMGRHESFTPPRPPATWSGALPSVTTGVQQIYESVYAHRDAPSAAVQMGDALEDLMGTRVCPMSRATSSELIETTLARAILESMADDPWRAASLYNKAVADHPEAGLTPLLVRDDWVEVPLWRVRENGQRMRAWDSDIERWLESPASAPPLLPRALFLTALVRLGMCDLFVHGLGGAVYDRAMEQWINDWLGVPPAPIAVVSATVRLPLGEQADVTESLPQATGVFRRQWHDPEQLDGGDSGVHRPGPAKASLLERIDEAPRGSSTRRELFYEMHRMMAGLREDRSDTLGVTRANMETARRRAVERPIIDRRTWPFPLYEPAVIDELTCRIREPLANQKPSPRT